MTRLRHLRFCIYFFFFGNLISLAQATISGTVTDKKGLPISGANVFLDGTYDGASTSDDGTFFFTSSETGDQLLLVSFLSYETYTFFGPVSSMKQLKISLKEDMNTLDAVVLSAGTFESSDNSKVSVLKPLDVVTTASALGDFVGALQTLPGTTTVAEDGRLFVRGGEAEETQIFIDGIRVFTPYTPTTSNIPTRGRYSPFLFDGITFSTGGYSAEYGQALSSVLLLNTVSEPDQNKTDISLMSVGGGVGHTKKWERSSISFSTSYVNLAPYVEAFPDRNQYEKPIEAAAGEVVFRQKTNQGLFKLYGAFDLTDLGVIQEDINLPEGLNFDLNNRNLYINTSYSGTLGDSWGIATGGSYTFARNKTRVLNNDIADRAHSLHGKVKLKKRFNNHFKLYGGVEHFYTDLSEDFASVFEEEAFAFTSGFSSHLSGAFVEGDLIFSKDLALKVGIRSEYSGLLDQFTVSPRTSLAYKTGKYSQISIAYGDFYQNPNDDVLQFSTEISAQKTGHCIANYQYTHNGRIFRAEAFRKVYSSLVTYDTEFASFDSEFTNDGGGFAQGIDIFWRDNSSVRNLDYWLSYSYLDSEREFRNFPERATPNFANRHNFSAIAKYFVTDWKSQFGFSYQYASGRAYTNPNRPGFLQEQTKAFNSISLNWAYLLSPQKILYASINNAFGFNNVNGFQYSNTPDANGFFDRRAIRPAADQFFFVGFFWTISDDKKSNQLNNL